MEVIVHAGPGEIEAHPERYQGENFRLEDASCERSMPAFSECR